MAKSELGPPFMHTILISMNLSNIAFLKMKNADYHCIITRITKRDAIKLSQNIDLTDKKNIIKLDMKTNFEALNLLQILMNERKIKIVN